MPTPVHQIACLPLPQQIAVTLSGGGGHDWVNPSLALFGTVLTVVVGVVTVIISNNGKEQELLIKSLEFLGGGTQKRAIGIALAANFGENKKYRKAVSTVLEAQKRYLEDKGFGWSETSNEEQLEDLNLRRIDEILGEREA